MKNKKVVNKTSITVENIEGFMVRKVTKFGSGAKVDCLKQYLGKTVYLIICKENKNKEVQK